LFSRYPNEEEMKSFSLTLLGLLVALPLQAQEPRPSAASVRELIAVMDAQKMTDGMFTQLDSAMQAGMQQALVGLTLNADQQKILDDMRTKWVTLFKAELAWTTFEPMLIDIYQQSFTDQEVNGMLQFYKSPSGKAVIAKMPAVMQSSLQAAQARLASLMPKLKQLQEETVVRLQEASK